MFATKIGIKMQTLIMFFCKKYINEKKDNETYHIFAQIKSLRCRSRTAKAIFKQTIFVHLTIQHKSMENFKIPTSNPYQKAYEDFLDTNLFSRLQAKFEVKPFYLRYKMLRNIMQASSFGINFFSAATAFTCVFLFIQAMLQNNVLSALLGTLFLGGLEAFKRLTIPDFCKNILQFRQVNWLKGVTILLLMSASVTLSYFGAKDSVLLFTPPATLTNVDDVKKDYKERIATLENRLKEVRKTQSWQGTLTPKGQKAYNGISEQIQMIEGDMLQNTNRITAQNDEITIKHTSKTYNSASVFGILTLLLDFSLIGLLCFIEYYDYRSFVEFAQQQNNVKRTTTDNNFSEGKSAFTNNQTVATRSNGIDDSILNLAIKKAKANIAAYDAKIRNSDGNEETNQKGRERWFNELQQLEAKLTMA
ncbi:MAG: hypothetical protein RLZZ292_3976 [Bacteroidota bacterium]|jgi:hypothetical protein